MTPDPFTSMKFGLTLGNSESNGYAEKRINSHHNTHNESAVIFARHSKIYDLAKVTQKINYQQIDNSRLADKTTVSIGYTRLTPKIGLIRAQKL